MIKHKFYAITDRKAAPGSDILSAMERALDAGVRMFQLREKDLASKDLLHLAHRAAELTRSYGAQLFINDRADIALAAGAEGVHLRTSSFTPEEARNFTRDLLIGASVHNADEARQKQQADFLLFGPVFPTPGKPDQGLNELQKACRSVDIPVYAVGGITPQNAGQCLEAGAFGVAAIRSWLEGGDEAESKLQQLAGL